MSYKFETTSYEFKCTSYEFEFTSYKFESASYEFEFTSYKFESASYEFEFTSYEFESTSYEFEFSSFEFESTGSNPKLFGNSWGNLYVEFLVIISCFTFPLLHGYVWVTNINFERRDLNSLQKGTQPPLPPNDFGEICFFIC